MGKVGGGGHILKSLQQSLLLLNRAPTLATRCQNQNQNSLLVKRQNDNTSPGDWPRKISPGQSYYPRTPQDALLYQKDTSKYLCLFIFIIILLI